MLADERPFLHIANPEIRLRSLGFARRHGDAPPSASKPFVGDELGTCDAVLERRSEGARVLRVGHDSAYARVPEHTGSARSRRLAAAALCRRMAARLGTDTAVAQRAQNPVEAIARATYAADIVTVERGASHCTPATAAEPSLQHLRTTAGRVIPVSPPTLLSPATR